MVFSYLSDKDPASNKNPPKASVYAEIIHCRLVLDTPNSSSMEANAMFELVIKTLSRNCEPEVTSKIIDPLHDPSRPCVSGSIGTISNSRSISGFCNEGDPKELVGLSVLEETEFFDVAGVDIVDSEYVGIVSLESTPSSVIVVFWPACWSLRRNKLKIVISAVELEIFLSVQVSEGPDSHYHL